MRVHTILLLAALPFVASPVGAQQSLFASLVDATERGDKKALVRILSTCPLSTSRGTVGADNYVRAGKMRHNVPAAKLADRLLGCAVTRWSEVPSAWDSGFVLWQCRTERAPENGCWFYTYRASLLDPRYHPPNLFIKAMPSRDVARCGTIAPPPLRMPSEKD